MRLYVIVNELKEDDALTLIGLLKIRLDKHPFNCTLEPETVEELKHRDFRRVEEGPGDLIQ